MTGFATSQSGGQPVRIFYRLFGLPGRTPMLIVHGLSFFSFDWIGPASTLAADRQVAAMDMRGFGDSDWPGEYGLEAHAADIVAVLDQLGWPRAILIGHSMGGRHAAVAAARHPERFEALVLVDFTPENAADGARRVAQSVASTPDAFESVEAALRWAGIDPASPLGRERRARYEAYLKRVPEGLTIKRDPHFRDQFRRQIATGEKHKLGLDMWQVLGGIRCPTLVIRGTRSDMFVREAVAKVAGANARISVVEVDAGHNVAADNPGAFNDAVRAFVAGLPSEVAG